MFDHVEVSWHKNEDRDQIVSDRCRRLCHHTSITPFDLPYEVQSSLSSPIQVAIMEKLINWAGFCNAVNCVGRFSKLSVFSHLFTSRDEEDTQMSRHEICNSRPQTSCVAKVNHSDEYTDTTQWLWRRGCPRNSIAWWFIIGTERFITVIIYKRLVTSSSRLLLRTARDVSVVNQ